MYGQFMTYDALAGFRVENSAVIGDRGRPQLGTTLPADRVRALAWLTDGVLHTALDREPAQGEINLHRRRLADGRLDTTAGLMLVPDPNITTNLEGTFLDLFIKPPAALSREQGISHAHLVASAIGAALTEASVSDVRLHQLGLELTYDRQIGTGLLPRIHLPARQTVRVGVGESNMVRYGADELALAVARASLLVAADASAGVTDFRTHPFGTQPEGE